MKIFEPQEIQNEERRQDSVGSEAEVTQRRPRAVGKDKDGLSNSQSRQKTVLPTPSSNPLLAPKWSIAQAAKIVGIGQTNLRRFVLSGQIPVIKMGGKYLLYERDLIDFLACRYGVVRKNQFQPSKLPPLPDFVRNSKYLRKAS